MSLAGAKSANARLDASDPIHSLVVAVHAGDEELLGIAVERISRELAQARRRALEFASPPVSGGARRPAGVAPRGRS